MSLAEALGAAGGTRLVRPPTRSWHWAPLPWGLASVGAAAALAGGAFHGFAATLPAPVG